MTRVFGAVMLAAMFLSGPCEKDQYSAAARQAELGKRVQAYHERFAWRDYEAASQFVLREMRGDFMTYADSLRRGYTVEGFALRGVKFNDKSDQAAVVVRRSFIQAPSVYLETKDITQEWVFKNNGWYLSGPPY